MGNAYRFGSVLLWFSTVIVLSAAACTPATSTPVAGAPTTPTRIPLQATLLVTGAITPTQLALSGSTLVWTDYRNGTADIYGYDLNSKREFPIATGPTSQLQPDVYGPLVVWAESDAIYGYRLDTGRRRRLIDVDRPQGVHLAWPLLVWTEERRDPGGVLALYTSFSAVVALDLTTGRITDLMADGFIPTARLTDQNRLLVYVYGERGIKRQDFAVVAYEPDTKTRIVLGPLSMSMLSGFAVHGRTVAWSVGPHGETHLVRLDPDGDRQDILFPKRAWVRAMAGEDTVVYEPMNRMAQPVGLAAANVRTGARYELMAAEHPLSVTADAGRVVWSTAEGHIWLAQLPNVAAPTPAPSLPTPVTPPRGPTPLPPTANGLAPGITIVAELPAKTWGRSLADPPLAPFDWSPAVPQLAYINDNRLEVAAAPDFQPHTLASGLREAVFPRWSPDGRMLAWLEAVPSNTPAGMPASNVSVITLAPTPTPRQFLPTGPPASRNRLGYVRQWRGTEVLLLADSAGGAAELNRISGELRRVVDCSRQTPPELIPCDPGATVTWSPTRPLLAVSRLKGNGWSKIVVLRSDADLNSVYWRTPENENQHFHDWSPDGRFFLYSRWGAGWPVATTPTDLGVWDVETRTGRRWVPDAFGAAWSPAGDRVAVLLTGTPRLDDGGRVIGAEFAVGQPFTTTLAVLTWPSGHLVAQAPVRYWPRLVDGDRAWQEFAQRKPVWSPDGNWVAYLGPDDELWVMRIKDATRWRVTQGLLRQAVAGMFSPAARRMTVAWSSDGQYLAVAVGGHIWVLGGPWQP